jgi:hypothetical protein
VLVQKPQPWRKIAIGWRGRFRHRTFANHRMKNEISVRVTAGDIIVQTLEL